MKRNYFNITLKATAAIIAALMLSLSACNTDDDDDDDDNTEDTKTVYTEKELMDEDGNVDQKIVTVLDKGEGTGTKTWDKTKTYVLDGFIFVNSGQTLTIPAGTIIKGKSGQGENASALIVAKGATLIAEGTSSEPIIFTTESDKVHYSHVDGEVTGTGNITVSTQGLWGGVIMLGKATTNNTGELRIEGIPAGVDRANYGASSGADDNDNSGSLEYVSIRHGGTDIGTGNEINGLTLGAVGSGTNFDYIEVAANIDDGVEFFGGAPNLKHVLVANCGDDSYDYDEGYHGKGQFWATINPGGNCGEHDGGKENETGEPYAEPIIYNVTYIGNGGKLIKLRDNAGGTYANSIFLNCTSAGIQVEYRGDKSSHSFKMMQDGKLAFKNNLFYNVMGDTTYTVARAENTSQDSAVGTFQYYIEKSDDGLPNDAGTQVVTAFTTTNSNFFENSAMGITSSSLVPTSASANATAAVPSDSFFDDVSYHGAFEPNGTNWASGWSLTFAN